jgi:predicted Rossmann fold nucleotide-binding protein DprA/Smf involved in DNA uptake
MMLTREFDIIPDDVNWKDTGCEIYPSCLNCPLDKCMEEEPRGRQRLRMLARSNRMAELRDQGKSICEIARCFQVSPRTVQRALAKVRETNDMKQVVP